MRSCIEDDLARECYRWRLLFTLASVLAVVFVCLHTSVAFAEIEDTDTSKAIVVAYDNSGSMMEKSERWCIGLYSLEVLAGMMNKNDVLTIVPMMPVDGKQVEVSIRGDVSASARVKSVHSTDFGLAMITDPSTPQRALEALNGMESDEKYLVIVTDGKFHGGVDSVTATVNIAADAGIQVLYLAIGQGADVVPERDGVEVWRTGSDAAVLETMKEIANRIFGRASLGTQSFNTGSNKLELDAPMRTLVVLAQGEDASVGVLKGPDGTTFKPDTAQVHYREHPFVKVKDGTYRVLDTDYDGKELNQRYWEQAEVNRSLVGQVGVFNEELPAGSYTLDVSGTDVEVYYKPYVDVETVLKDEKGSSLRLSEAVDMGYMEEGAYSVSYEVKDPFTGKHIQSSLIGEPQFSLTFTSDEGSTSYHQGDAVDLSAGHFSILTTAELAGNVRVSNKYGSVKIVGTVEPLDIDASALSSGFDASRFNNKEQGALITVAKRNGEEISEAEWSQLDATVKSDNGLTWQVEKTDNIGELRAYPTTGKRTTDEAITDLLGVGPFSFVRVPSREFPTTAIVRIDDDYHPFAGMSQATPSITSPLSDWLVRLVSVLAAVAIIVWLVWLIVWWPTLPAWHKMQPYLTSSNYKEPFNMDRKVRYKKVLRRAEGRIFPPYRRTQILAVHPSEYIDSVIVCPGTLELEALPKRKGAKRFQLSKSTIAAMYALVADDEHGLPDPKWDACEVVYRAGQVGPSGRGRSTLRGRRKRKDGIGYTIEFMGFEE